MTKVPLGDVIVDMIQEFDRQTQTYCYYNAKENTWLEHTWNDEMGMFQYEMAGEYGRFAQGYMGSSYIETLASKGWEVIGSL